MTDFYAHDHSQARGNNPNVKPLSALYDGVVAGAGGVNHGHGTVKLAVGNMQRAYQEPARRGKDSPDKVLCAFQGCKAFPMKTIEYCTGHARSLGLIENWASRGAKPEVDEP